MYPQPPLGWHGFEFVNVKKPRKLPQVHCHPLSSMRVRIELLTDFAPGERTGELFVRQSLPMASAIRHAAVDAAYFHAVQPLAGLILWGLRWTNVPGATICAVVVVPGMTTRHLRETCSNTGFDSALRKALNQGGCPCTLSLHASRWGPPSIGDATHIKNWGLVRVLVLVNN